MKNLVCCILSVAALLTLSSCATPYQAQGGFLSDGRGGYTDKKISEGKYWIRFLGNGYTEMIVVQQYWEKRASELCGGRPYKKVANPNYEEKTDYGYANGTVYVSRHKFPTVEGIVECES